MVQVADREAREGAQESNDRGLDAPPGRKDVHAKIRGAMVLLSIDPGKRACGVALFLDGRLFHAAYVTAYSNLEGPTAWRAIALRVRQWAYEHRVPIDQVAFEQPSAYRSDRPYKTKILHDLVGVDAWICALYPDAVHFRYSPQMWKGSMKKDSGKPSLFPILGAAQALAEIAAVLHFGAKKYAPSKWREGMNWSRLIDALLKHVTAFANGESTDPETGLSQLGHAGCCVLFLLTYQLENLGTDDRWALSKKQD